MRASAERNGYEIRGAIHRPHTRPWSTVFRAPTRRGAQIARRLGILTRAARWYRVLTLTGAPDVGSETLGYWLSQIPRAFSARSARSAS